MVAWTNDELDKIGAAEELEIAPVQGDGTLRNPTTIWVVRVGDITYYAPWGNLAIFYRDFGYASRLVVLGKLDSGIEALDVPSSVRVTIELVE